ncbi:helix-turn-helix transcriptional regulator [Ruegeria atlantica]|uniref:helix-turn-helix transcriptional regulator n=1 Tax=Ruegeria atlantica TaxID=81569 RepID=UPI001480A656|nr:AlpA family phage regulatory protein [Ruegeria atlantica]
MTLTPNRYITLCQLSEKLGGRSRSSIYRDLENGHIPNPIRVGSRLYWCEEEVDEFLKSLR